MKKIISELKQASKTLAKLSEKKGAWVPDQTAGWERIDQGSSSLIKIMKRELSELENHLEDISELCSLIAFGTRTVRDEYLKEKTIRFLNELKDANLAGDISDINKQAIEAKEDLRQLLRSK